MNFAAQIQQCPHCKHYQKYADETYLTNTQSIYSSYAPYDINQGKEQQNYSADVPFTRCSEILSICAPMLPDTARFLDIGTGSGVMLEAATQSFKHWQLNAHDVSDHQQLKLQEKYNLHAFFCGDLSLINTVFDVVTLVHVLEHVPTPNAFLAQLSSRLSEQGIAIIQVPNITENEWDFAIYDHVSHFSKETLAKLLNKHFKHVFFPSAQLNKEITVLVSNSMSFDSNKQACKDEQSNPIKKLSEKLDMLAQLPQCYVLGTGPAACFCAHLLDNRFLGWLDEDQSKIGKFMENKQILPANRLYNAPILLPYPRAQIENICARLPDNHYIY
nr:class I SAM-dependent methyltransferase [Pseudoalteromonas sp. MMG022]